MNFIQKDYKTAYKTYDFTLYRILGCIIINTGPLSPKYRFVDAK